MDFRNIDESHGDDDNGFHYYYNREERLAHAPKIVQDYYNNAGPQLPKGVFRSLIATPFNRIILITLVAVVVIGWFVSRSAPDTWEKDIGEVTVSLSAFSYIDSVYAAVTCTPKSGAKAAKESVSENKVALLPVEVVFSTIDDSGSVIDTDKILVTYDGKEIAVRTEFTDYDIVSVSADVTVNGEPVTLTRQVEKH